MSQTSGADVCNAGWTRRFTAIGARLQEEVRLEAADTGSEDVADRAGCADCFVMTLAQTIYTRPSGARTDEIAAER
jgi:hypothetical protein